MQHHGGGGLTPPPTCSTIRGGGADPPKEMQHHPGGGVGRELRCTPLPGSDVHLLPTQTAKGVARAIARDRARPKKTMQR